MKREHQEITPLIRHLRWHDAIQRLSQGVLMAMALNLIIAIAARLWPLWHRETLIYTLIWSIGASAMLAGIVGGFWPSPSMSQVRRLDLGMALADRLTTLWELSKGHITAPSPLTAAQREETRRHLRGLDVHEAFPLQPNRRTVGVLILLGLTLIPLYLLPNPQETALARREAQALAEQETIARLAEIQETLATSPDLTEAQREAALQALNEALTTLEAPTAAEAEQHLALNQLEQQLAALQSPDNETQILRLAEAVASAASDTQSLSTEEARVVDTLMEAMQQGDLAAAAAYLRALTGPEGEALSEQALSALADAFNAMADDLQATDPALAERFRQISQEMYTQDAAGAREALQQAADTLSQIDQAYAGDRALEQAQAQVQAAREQLRQAESRGDEDLSAWGRRAASPQGQGQPSSAADGAQTGGENGQGQGQGEQGTGAQGGHDDRGSGAPYAPNGADPRLEGQGGDQITLPRPVEPQGDPQSTLGQRGAVRVPYQEVYADYAASAEAKLSRQAYPPGLRAYIQTYFSNLER